MQKHLYKHFQNERHSGFRDDVPVILTAKTDDSNPLKEKQTGCEPWKL